MQAQTFIDVPGGLPLEHEYPVFLNEPREFGESSEHDDLSRILDFHLAAGQQTMPVTDFFRNDDPAEPVNCSFHTRTPAANMSCQLPFVNGNWG